MHKTRAGLLSCQARHGVRDKSDQRYQFGGLAVVVTCVTLDPWFCAPGFRRVYLYRLSLFAYNRILHQNHPPAPFTSLRTHYIRESNVGVGYHRSLLPNRFAGREPWESRTAEPQALVSASSHTGTRQVLSAMQKSEARICSGICRFRSSLHLYRFTIIGFALLRCRTGSICFS
jgi:hypothetical protein